MRKIFAILIALSLIGSVATIAGCEPSEELPEYTLQFAHIGGPGGFASAGVEAFAEDLTEATDGRVTVNITAGIPPTQAYDMLIDGLYDAVFFNPVQCAPSLFPMASISTLPFTHADAVIHTKALWALWQADYLDSRLYDTMKVIFIWGDQGSGLIMKAKNVTAPADLGGEVLHVVAGMQEDIFQALNASTDSSIAAGEVSSALAACTLTGNVKGYSPLPLFNWCDYAYSVTEPKLGSVFFVFAINLAKWNSLPTEDQALINSLIGTTNEYGLVGAAYSNDLTATGKQCLQNHGTFFNEWDDIDAIGTLLGPIWTDWIDDREGVALPAEEALELFYNVQETEGAPAPIAIGWAPSP